MISNKTTPPRVWRVAPALTIAIRIALSGCTSEIGDAFREAGDKIESMFEPQAEPAIGSSAARKISPTAEASYRAGLEARSRGDEDLGLQSFKEAARLGHAAATYEVSRVYAEGRGVTPDLDLAADWTNLAAERGDARAQFLIGTAFYGGIGVIRDYKRAAVLLTESAVQGHAQAQYLLGEATSNGRGVARDDAWAARWYAKAAMQGLGEAQYAYGVVYAAGLGVPKDLRAAYAWLGLAARAGHEDAKAAGKAVAAQLNPGQIEQAELWIARFQPGPSKAFADEATIIYVQHALNRRGFDAGPVDGIAGARTRAAVRRFQTTAGLAADGAISSDLLDRLRATPPKQS